MAFDSPTRNRLAGFVTDARELLTAEFGEKLQRLYGIAPSGETTSLKDLAHLDENQRLTARLLRERLDYLVASSTGKPDAAAAVDRLLREQAFTVLNRLAALRLAERRGIIQE